MFEIFFITLLLIILWALLLVVAESVGRMLGLRR